MLPIPILLFVKKSVKPSVVFQDLKNLSQVKPQELQGYIQFEILYWLWDC